MTLAPKYTRTCNICRESYMTDNMYGDISCYQCQEKAMEPIRKMQDNWFNLSEYLKKEISEGEREFRIFFPNDNRFIIHPMNKYGETKDFEL